jgi:SEC-C motif-containing protein
MRSRYTAFALGNEEYLLTSWHPLTRPSDIDLDADQRWERLDIIASARVGDEGTVTFRAHWRLGAERGVLEETSRFRRQRGRWYYLDGDVGDSTPETRF